MWNYSLCLEWANTLGKRGTWAQEDVQVRAVGKVKKDFSVGQTQQLLVAALSSQRKDGVKDGGLAKLKLVNKWLGFVALEFTHPIPGLFLVVRSMLYLNVCRCETVTLEVGSSLKEVFVEKVNFIKTKVCCFCDA